MVKSCHKELAEMYEERLKAKGLRASIERGHEVRALTSRYKALLLTAVLTLATLTLTGCSEVEEAAKIYSKRSRRAAKLSQGSSPEAPTAPARERLRGRRRRPRWPRQKSSSPVLP